MKRKDMTRGERNFMFSSQAYKRTHPARKKEAKPVAPVVAPIVAEALETAYNLFSYATSGEFVRGFHNVTEAKEYLNVNDISHIYKVLNGKRRVAFGYIWTKSYKPELEVA